MGKNFIITCFGESHGTCLGVVIDGCPPGLKLSDDDIQRELNKRKPTVNRIFTSRQEEDKVEVLSGVFNGYTTGAPICMRILNEDVESKPYEELRWTPRPGHADYPAWIRYKGFNDYRGGGRFSGRITAAYVMAGAVAKKLLNKLGIEVLAHVVQIGHIKMKTQPSLKKIRAKVYTNTMRCVDAQTARLMRKVVFEAREEGDSVGGIIEGIALNVPPGVGTPIFDSLDADIAKAMFNIPAVKGVEFGAGFNVASLKGSQSNDPYTLEEERIVTLTNNSGGILGGLATGMPIIVRVAFKPTPSISKPQKTVNIKEMKETEIRTKGRYDACIVPRAVPIVESMLTITLADHLLGLYEKPKEANPQ
jgi:chorismate synthase